MIKKTFVFCLCFNIIILTAACTKTETVELSSYDTPVSTPAQEVSITTDDDAAASPAVG